MRSFRIVFYSSVQLTALCLLSACGGGDATSSGTKDPDAQASTGGAGGEAPTGGEGTGGGTGGESPPAAPSATPAPSPTP